MIFPKEFMQQTRMQTLEWYSRSLAAGAESCIFHKEFAPETRSSDFSGLRMRDARVRVPSPQRDTL